MTYVVLGTSSIRSFDSYDAPVDGDESERALR